MSSLGRDIQAKLLDKELALNERTGQLEFTNERQLADLAAKISRDENSLAQNLQDMDQAAQTRLAASEYAANTYAQAYEFASRDRQMASDRAFMESLKQKKAEAEARARKARKKAAGVGKMIGAAKMAAGAAIIYGSGGTATTLGASMMTEGGSQVASSEG